MGICGVWKASWKWLGNVVEAFGVWRVLLPNDGLVGVAVGLGKVQSALLCAHEQDAKRTYEQRENVTQ